MSSSMIGSCSVPIECQTVALIGERGILTSGLMDESRICAAQGGGSGIARFRLTTSPSLAPNSIGALASRLVVHSSLVESSVQPGLTSPEKQLEEHVAIAPVAIIQDLDRVDDDLKPRIWVELVVKMPEPHWPLHPPPPGDLRHCSQDQGAGESE